MTRAIYIPGKEMWVSIPTYIKGIKLAKANPDATFSYGLTTWASCTGSDIMRQFMAGLHDRINQAIPYSQRGRK